MRKPVCRIILSSGTTLMVEGFREDIFNELEEYEDKITWIAVGTESGTGHHVKVRPDQVAAVIGPSNEDEGYEGGYKDEEESEEAS